jgi:hypothetical protein
MTTETTKPKRKRLTPSERLARMGERYLKLSDAGKKKFEARRKVLSKMISAGLMLDKPIVLSGEPFILVDNFDGDKTGGWATVNRFDLKPISQKKARDLGVEAGATPAEEQAS